VTDLRLHRSLYEGTAVDEAAKIYGPYASLELIEEAEHWLVRVGAASPERERRVAGELANYALGLTVKARRSAASTSQGAGAR
jgi:hypothetical protein